MENLIKCNIYWGRKGKNSLEWGGGALAAMSKTPPIINCQQSLLDVFQVAKSGSSWQHRWLFDAHALEMPKSIFLLTLEKNNTTVVFLSHYSVYYVWPFCFVLFRSATCSLDPNCWTLEKGTVPPLYFLSVWRHVHIMTATVNCYIWHRWHVML